MTQLNLNGPPILVDHLCGLSHRMIRRLIAGLTLAATLAAANGSYHELNHLTAALIAEAQTATRKHALPRQRPTIHAEFVGEVPNEKLVRSILRPAHSDDFVDAYVRWQLTSFDITLPAIPDREFQSVLARLPAISANPYADRATMQSLAIIALAGELAEPDLQRVNATLNDLARLASYASEFKTPAINFRAWLIDALDDNHLHGALARLEQIAATIRAGWDVSELKLDLEKHCDRLGRSQQLSTQQRLAFDKAAQRLVGEVRVHLASVRIVERSLELQYADSAVYDFDVRRWNRLLIQSPQ